MVERCGVCGCPLYRGRDAYANETLQGRRHATKHHYVAERFFGRSANRRGTVLTPVFRVCPWKLEGQSGIFCYECHELLIHNPAFLPGDVAAFAELVSARWLSERRSKPNHRRKIAGRIQLLQEVITRGLQSIREETHANSRPLNNYAAEKLSNF